MKQDIKPSHATVPLKQFSLWREIGIKLALHYIFFSMKFFFKYLMFKNLSPVGKKIMLFSNLWYVLKTFNFQETQNTYCWWHGWIGRWNVHLIVIARWKQTWGASARAVCAPRNNLTFGTSFAKFFFTNILGVKLKY